MVVLFALRRSSIETMKPSDLSIRRASSIPLDVFRVHPLLEGTSFRLQAVWFIVVGIVFESVIREAGGSLQSLTTRLLALLVVITFGVLFVMTRKLFPFFIARRFADHIAISASPTSEDKVLAEAQKFHVGVLNIAAIVTPGQVTAPSCTVYYPTDAPPPSMLSRDLPSHTPYGDKRVGYGIMRYQGTPWFGALHLTDARIAATVNGAITEALKASPQLLGTDAHPVVIFSHGLAAHRHFYSSLIMDLVALGAIVIAVAHCDGSAAFALDPKHSDAAMPDDFHAVQYTPTPSSTAAEVRLRCRQMHDRRIPELQRIITFTQSPELSKILGLSPRSPSAAPIRPALVGHSFGAATVVGTALKESLLRRVSAVVAFDFWSVPSQWILNELDTLELKTVLPPLSFVDSLEWHRWDVNREMEVDITRRWTSPCSRRFNHGTDHLTLTDAPYLFKAPFIRMWFKTADDRRQTALWASSAFTMVSKHAQRRRTKQRIQPSQQQEAGAVS